MKKPQAESRHIPEVTHEWWLECGKDGACAHRRLVHLRYNPPAAGLNSVYAGLKVEPTADGYWQRSPHDTPFQVEFDDETKSLALGGWESFRALGEMGGVNPFEKQMKHELGCRVCKANLQVGFGKWESLVTALVKLAGPTNPVVTLAGLQRAYAVALKLPGAP